jgi:iron complex transport system substrate-binding protein
MPPRPPAAAFAALLLFVVAAFAMPLGPARSADFIDAAGRRVPLPDRIGRIMPATPAAEVLVLVLAPDKLAAVSAAARRGEPRGRLPPLPPLTWRPMRTPASMVEAARRLRPDLIIDAAPITPQLAAFADQVQQQTGIPYMLIDDSFARTPALLRSIGTALGVADRAQDLALFAEHAIAALRGRLLIRSPDSRPHVYYARRPDGLETALPGSAAGEAIDQAGAINVAAVLGRGQRTVVTREQIWGWNPQIIIAEDPRFYAMVRKNPAWRRIAAVRDRHVYLAPSNPFGWIDDPPGVNRLIGLYWLSGLFYPDATQEDLRTVACEFYDKFYGIKLTNAQLEALVRPAGTPPIVAPQPIKDPLAALGAPPPSALPPIPGLPSPAAGGRPFGATQTTCAVTGTASLLATPAAVSPLPEALPGVAPPGRRGRNPAAGPGSPVMGPR